jgi:hypothetical protein
MQQRPGAVIANVLLRLPCCYSKGGFGDLGREAEGAAEEFLIAVIRQFYKTFWFNVPGRGEKLGTLQLWQ